MKTLTFSTQINAPKERVWNTLWDDTTYRLWASVFCEGSQAKTDWQEGSKVLFVDGKGDGMVSKIARLIPFEFMSFQHLGMIKDGIEDFATAEAKGWSGALENYSLRPNNGGIELVVTIAPDDNFAGYFEETFPKALQQVKALAELQKITPFLWFDQQAEEAMNLYVSVFPNSTAQTVVRNGSAVLTASFSLNGQTFTALNGGPQFKLNPSISFYTICETAAEVDAVWEKLVEGGQVLMPLDTYAWSEKYGWLQDRFGVSWQITLGKIEDLGQKFTPALLFAGEQQGRAEEAINFYSSIFKHSSTKLISRYGAGGIDLEGTVNHAQFKLDGQGFIVMDSAMPHAFQFNEAVSFVINCDTQEAIDYCWNKLIDGGGTEGQCGWLKDKFGVSWQVVPPALGEMLGSSDPGKSQRVMQAILQMKKLDIATLRKAFEGA